MSRPVPSAPFDAPRSAFREVLPRLVLGFGLAAAGLLFTLDNVDLLDADDWLGWWPVLLVAFGVGLIASGRNQSERFGGVIWSLVGSFLLLDDFGLPFDFWDLWPLALVAGGITLVLRALKARDGAVAPPAVGADGQPLGPGGGRVEDPTVHGFAMMSGVATKNSSIGFQGGTLTAVMGGVEVDLRGASLAGGRAVIDCFALWGGIEITVPPGWIVTGRTWLLMAGYEDKSAPPAPEDATGELILQGAAVMGGVSVKN